jgi:hypothetical protein
MNGCFCAGQLHDEPGSRLAEPAVVAIKAVAPTRTAASATRADLGLTFMVPFLMKLTS